ncbi:cysteine proteinase [Hymenopellis radicata]|nr:cysteine proteinase [Hymenopellis radicata]
MAYNNRLEMADSAPLVDSVARAPSSTLRPTTVPIRTVGTQREKLKALLEYGPDRSDPRLWHFECHGLYNPHNMCFRNAALQGLIHTSAFAQLFLQLGDVLERDEFIHVAPLVHATVDFIRMFYRQAGGGLLDRVDLFAALTAAMPMLFRTAPIAVEQGEDLVMQSAEDSGEFLAEYLRKLNFEFDLIRRSLRSPAWRSSSSQLDSEYMMHTNQTAIYSLFGVTISEKPGSFVMMIPINRNVSSVTEGLRLYFQHIREPAYFEQLPAVLVLNLGCFVFDYARSVRTTVKTIQMIDIPEVLDIPEEFLTPYYQPPSTVQYRLSGVVYHHGATAITGHYTADVAHPGHRFHHRRARDEEDARPWFRMNDTAVSAVRAADVYRATKTCRDGTPSTKTPFVLFYERI